MSDALERVVDRLESGRVLQWMFRGLVVCTLIGGILDMTGMLDDWFGEPSIAETPTRIEPTEVEFPTDESKRVPYRPGDLPVTDPATRPAPRLPTGESAPDPRIGPMQFEFKTTPDGVPYILGVGDFGVGAFEGLKRLDRKHDETARYLILMSLGGWVSEALAMGKYLREREMKVIVPSEGYCFSACPVAMAGGVERVVYPNAWIGVHRARLSGRARGSVQHGFEAGQSDTAEMMAYFEAMGVDPSVWRRAVETPHEEIYFLSANELKETKLATIVSANIKMR